MWRSILLIFKEEFRGVGPVSDWTDGMFAVGVGVYFCGGFCTSWL